LTGTATPVRLPRALSAEELDRLREVPKNPRDQALIEVLAGCGLRVSEACNLHLDQIHWRSDTPSLRFTGKRGKERVVPLNLQAQDALRAWLDQRGEAAGPLVFCNLRTGGRLSRKTVWETLRRYARQAGLRPVHPHMLRHAFGTHLADQQVPIERIRELMGHASIQTSQLYISVSAAQKRAAVERLDQRSPLTRWLSRRRNQSFRFFSQPPRPAPTLHPQTVGRQAELQHLQANLDKGVDTLVLGPIGVGKSHLLSLLKSERLIRVNSLSPVRQGLAEIAQALHQRGVFSTTTRVPSLPAAGGPQPADRPEGEPACGSAAGRAPGEDFEAFRKQHARTPVPVWTQMILEAVEKDQWVLAIDDLPPLSPTLGRLLDQLGKKFSLIVALPEVKKGYEKHFWRFERISLCNLTREEARQLIRQGAAGLQVPDFQLLETRLLQQSAGNPKAIVESLNRLRREPQVTPRVVRELAPTGARAQLDITPLVIIPVVLLAASRFLARGLGDAEFYIVAGVGTALMMGVQFALFRMRR
jgi:hypothetical protein